MADAPSSGGAAPGPAHPAGSVPGVAASWPHEEIMRVARRVMDDRRGYEAKMRAIGAPGVFRDFFEGYPKLFQVCCRASTPSERAEVERQLEFMLAAMRRHRGAPELASRTVHEMLTEKYISPVVEGLPAPPGGGSA